MGASLYVMNIGIDLRLVDTNTLEVVDVISYQKQIIGRQISAGVFDFLGQNFFDASLGESALEPIQLAVRTTIERATLEMMSRLYRAPTAACGGALNTASDPLYDGKTVASNEEKYNDKSRQEPYRWLGNSDGDADPGLRGRLQ